nr:serine hydrolase [Allomuricauda sp.]
MRRIHLGMLFSLLICLIGNSQQIDESVLDKLKKRTLETHSDAVIIKQNGKTIYEYSSGQEKPIYIASAGKSLASLAIGKLIEQKLLDSIDQPVYTIFPEWKQGTKKKITVRMLLNHTSGLQNNPNASVELEPAPDYQVDNIIKLALAAELSDEPGTVVSYNNKAVSLLGGIVQELSGKPFDDFFVDEFYKPMNIEEYSWIEDKSGNPTLHGAFIIKPTDLLKFGELLLNNGVYDGKRIIEESWVKQSLRQSQEFTPIWGLLWWRLPSYEKRIIDDAIWSRWKKEGVSNDFLRKLMPLLNVLFESKEEFFEALKKELGENWSQILNKQIPSNMGWSSKIYGKEILAYYANGFRGNFLVVVPESDLVAIRMADSKDFNYDTDFFSDFVRLVSML